LEQALVIGVDAKVFGAVVKNKNVAETLEPIGINHLPGSNGLDPCAFGRPQYNTPPQAAIGPFGAETALHLAPHRVWHTLAQALQRHGSGFSGGRLRLVLFVLLAF